jgi:isoleucyl-tRNA synthetase
MSENQIIDYKNTLNLPQTDFKMKANAAIREVELQKYWEDETIYEKNIAQRDKTRKFILHDGPPYLSSDKIHIGTALNKILKDIIIKYKSQSGFYSPYIPGYDGHGLPIENAVVKSIKGGREALTPEELRKKCREFALKNLKGQETNFKRLGVMGNWEHPYITIDAEFESIQVKVFGEMAKKGYVYKGLKPVYWCAECETALAEAEVEYADHKSHSVYVKFGFEQEEAQKAYKAADLTMNNPLFTIIWTTTPWTLPANLAIALHPRLQYAFVQKNDSKEVYIIAVDLLENFASGAGWEENSYKILGSTTGEKLEYINTRHPFMDRNSLIILGEHVTTEAGTGAVHTAPGHGLEDYEVGTKYKIGVVSPLTNKGIFTEEAGKFAGLRYNKANEVIIQELQEKNALIAHGEISHSYPHCWRCKKPVIYRATEQWFISVESFRDQTLKAIDEVKWIPVNNYQRIYNMVESRSDWCISRQRAWGVPIPVFYCSQCNKSILTDETINHVAQIFAKESSDAWSKYSAKELMPADYICSHCGNKEFKKETDIMDVWFDSGVTHAAVVDARKDELCGTPVELYLEGSDQHRGWFQSSLLTSIATKGRAPYKSVLTHGFVLDAQGRKMSKSLGNVIEPQNIVNKYGADVLRLWAASVDYTNDVRIGENTVQQLVEVYKKVRNTCRFLLGNLYDFDPETDLVEYSELGEIDKFALHKLQKLVESVTISFDKYEFYRYYQLIQNFVSVDLSSTYLDIIKDRLYTGGKNSLSRKSCQTVMYKIMQVLTRIFVPVTPHLAEDIWQFVPEKQKEGLESILLSNWPKVKPEFLNEQIDTKWNEILNLREAVTKAIEPVRADKKIGSSLETSIFIKVINKPDLYKILKDTESELANIFITSQAVLIENGAEPENILNKYEEESFIIYAAPASGEKCERCWKFSGYIGKDPTHKTLCKHCIEAI